MTEIAPEAKPPMPEMMAPHVASARQRHEARPASPGVVFEERKAGRWRIGSPHADREAWEVMICDAFGTRSHSTMWTFLDQLRELMGEYHDGERWVPDEFAVNAALNIINAAQPENEIQAALAAQMVAVHFLTMRAAQRHGASVMVNDRDVAMVSKLARTFAMQAETLGRLQGKVKTQEITVRYEKHIHHHAHTHLHDERHVHLSGGASENGGQGFGPIPAGPVSAGAYASGPALHGPDSFGGTLSEARDQGPAPVSVARMREGIGGTDRPGERQLSDGLMDHRGDGAESPGRQGAQGLARVEG